MEALALAVASAVIQYLVDKTDLLENVRGWLKRDPTSLAYQRALLRAYAAFARSDPALAKSFFDETFLTSAAVPELAKQLTRHEHANGAELARLWAAALYADALAEQRAAWATDVPVMNACANFLQWLEAELKREQVFLPLFDSRALDALETKVDELTRALTAQRDEAMKRAEQYQPVINQIARQTSVNISDSSNVVVYGDINGGDKFVRNYFYGNFTSLDDYYISPESVYQRVKIDEFVGREWLVGRIDAFLNEASRTSGMFRIEGEAGVGKTAFLAHLVLERGYLHLFAEQVPGDNNVERALLSLGAQIVSRYRLDPYADRNTLPAIAGFSDFVFKLLNHAAQRLTAGEKIIIVCDALDEAGNGTNGNVFGLPATLPDNVYFILSQRPVSVRLDVKCEIHNERVKPDNAENLHDVQDYLCGMAQRTQIAQQLRNRKYSDDEFVRVLADKSGGVWMYLQYVLDEIVRGSRHPLELDALPNGLVGYYLAYWGDWRAGRNHRGKGENEWYALYLPLLTTLAAAQEPIPLDTLIAWAGVNATTQYQVRNLLREQWRSFISEREEQGHAARFILYHASLRDFLTGKVDTNALSSADGNFMDELRDGTRAAHQHVIANFTERCRGTWTDLIHDNYARRYLCLHLEGAEQYDQLAALVAWSDAWAKARYDKEETWSGYLTDLERVWTFAEQKENVGWQIRCALIKSTIHSLVGNISSDLLLQLIKTKLWSPARALAHIPHMPSDYEKAQAIEKLAPLLPHELLGEALAAARGIQNEDYRANALRGLAAHLSAEQMAEALAAARAIQHESYRASALSDLATQLSGEQKEQVMNEAMALARGIQDEYSRARTLSGLAAHLSRQEKEQVVGEALALAWGMQDEQNRAFALIWLAAYLSAEQMGEALVLARGIQDERSRKYALSELEAHLPDTEKVQVVSEALAAAREIQVKGFRQSATSGLVTHLSAKDEAQAVGEALMAARRVLDEQWHAHMLSELAVHLSNTEKLRVVGEALVTIRGIQDEHRRVDALRGLARNLSSEQVSEALAITREIENEGYRADALRQLAAYLSAEQMSEALSLAREIQDAHSRAYTLSELTANLSGEEKMQVVGEALAAAREIQGERGRTYALGELAAHLWGEERRSVMHEALVSARGIQGVDYRAAAMSDLAAHLSNTEKVQVAGDALAIIWEIQGEYSRVNALRGLAAYLSAEQMSEALVMTRGIEDDHLRAHALRGLAAHLSAEQMGEALAIARGIQSEYWLVDALCSLAVHLPDAEKAQVAGEGLAAAHGIRDEINRLPALLSLMVHLADSEKRQTLGEVLSAARGIQGADSRVRAMSDLAIYLAGEEKMQVVREGLAAARGIQDVDSRVRALSRLATHLPDVEQPEILAQGFDIASHSISLSWQYRPELIKVVLAAWEILSFKGFEHGLWNQGLHALARHPRDELLEDLTTLLPLIRHLGGQAAVGEMFYALRDVTRWWP